jgi:hypothetical protein
MSSSAGSAPRRLLSRALLIFLITLPGLLGTRIATAQIGVGISVNLPAIELRADVAPPELPVYVQPEAPADGYLWTPGYWRWGAEGYFWVPGTWVEPPEVGVLWTPGWWGWEGGAYVFRPGYWGPHVGFYGGVDYGFGYGGDGFAGGRWEGGHFAYNTSVTNINRTVIHNTYNETVINRGGSHVSFNGPQGVHAEPTREQLAAAQERHIPPTSNQVQHYQQAAQNRSLLASANHGHPAIAATSRPGDFRAAGAAVARPVAARSGAPAANARAAATTARHEPASNPRSVESQPRGESPTRSAPAGRAIPAPAHVAEPTSRAEPTNRASPRPAEHPQAASQARPAAHAEARPPAEARPQPHAAPKEEHREER